MLSDGRVELNRSMTRRIRVLELRSVRGTGGGPEKTIMLGAAIFWSDPEISAFPVLSCCTDRLSIVVDTHIQNPK